MYSSKPQLLVIGVYCLLVRGTPGAGLISFLSPSCYDWVKGGHGTHDRPTGSSVGCVVHPQAISRCVKQVHLKSGRVWEASPQRFPSSESDNSILDFIFSSQPFLNLKTFPNLERLEMRSKFHFFQT